ncbi:hypothetical protein [Paraburkholderia sp. C35]|uniref:hypothetical protein n=1 Tax=Paraburkholderia sp. C35 TaxID=2126993 RepID=UPI000D6927A3|nr:hypothetical protein [Paraburkholderia sp. C35]
MTTMTLNEKMDMIQHMAKAADNALSAPTSHENDSMQHTRHVIALLNLQRLGDMVREAERELAAALIADARASTIAIRFDTPAKLA